jgi:hypothetical protein
MEWLQPNSRALHLAIAEQIGFERVIAPIVQYFP